MPLHFRKGALEWQRKSGKIILCSNHPHESIPYTSIFSAAEVRKDVRYTQRTVVIQAHTMTIRADSTSSSAIQSISAISLQAGELAH